ncbi:MAG: endonuclease [Pedobacter sp.]|nr:MAG: endonuclease [Pedobacter sp.]
MHHLIYYLSVFTIISTIIPFIRHDYWVFRVFEYPRLQKLCLNIVLLTVILTNWFPSEIWEKAVAILLLLNLIYLCYLIFPYTIFAKRQIISSRNPSGKQNLKILIANVYQDNKKAKDYHELINECEPDVILLVETNQWWAEQMSTISRSYPHQITAPLENTYGMLLYSKLPLNGEVNFLVESDIPSIQATVTLNSGQTVQLFCLHPKPPVPQESTKSTERDKEILMIAVKAKESKLPVVVMGDLNDVAWSYTTDLFGKISGLLDPRRGRGFFNSFNAKYFFLRFPLDHIFCSADFALKSIARLRSCGSDHFPMCVNLEYAPQLAQKNEHPVASTAEKELTIEKINA